MSHFCLWRQLQPSVERVRYLDDADGLPGEMKAGVEEECEDEGECSVPAQRRHQRATLSDMKTFILCVSRKNSFQLTGL